MNGGGMGGGGMGGGGAANRRRGEVAIELDGRSFRMRLTLNALAELEAAYAAENLAALVERFGSGRLSAADLARIVGAGLRGAGEAVTDAEAGAMTTPGGAAGFAAKVSELLTLTFGGAQAQENEGAAGGAEPRP